MNKIITGIAIVNDTMGKKVVFTYSIVNEQGAIIDNNKKQSYLAVDAETKEAIENLEACVTKRIGATTREA